MYFSRLFFLRCSKRAEPRLLACLCSTNLHCIYSSSSLCYACTYHAHVSVSFALWDGKLWTCCFTVDQDQKKVRHFDEERHDSHDKMWLSDVSWLRLYIINLKLLSKCSLQNDVCCVLCRRLCCESTAASFWKKRMKSAVSLQRLRVKVWLHVLHSATMHVSDFDVFAVRNPFQMQDRNLWSGSGLTLCTSVFRSCDPPQHVVAFLFELRFLFLFFSFFSLPVHLMNMATHSKRLFPVQDALEKAPTVPHSLIISDSHDPHLETRILMLFTETTSFSLTLTCWNHHILLFCHFPFSLPLISFKIASLRWTIVFTGRCRENKDGIGG